MIHIRPYQIFSAIENPDEPLTFFIPSLSKGGLTSIESMVLVAMLKRVRPLNVFEFGTFKGYSTRLLLENLDDREGSGPRVFTLDLPSLDKIRFQGDDGELAEEGLGFPRKYALSGRSHLVRQILQDSMTLETAPYMGQFQFIFIDGNHQIDYVRKDTENALSMLDGTGGCIVWHDYRNEQFPELTGYLESLSETLPLVHIEDTMLVAFMPGLELPPRRNP